MPNFTQITAIYSSLTQIARLLTQVEGQLTTELIEDDIDCQRLVLEIKALSEQLECGKINYYKNLQN